MTGRDIDEIYNLACPASPPHYKSDELQTLRSSAIGLDQLLALAKEKQARILHTSTSEVYGDPEVHPQPESYWGHVNPLGARACYDEGKRYAEALCRAYYLQHGVDIRMIRIFNTYGPRMAKDDGRVVTNFINQALTGEALTVYGDGTQTRSLCYVDDLIIGMRAVMKKDEKGMGPTNLGNDVEMTISDLAKVVIELVGSQSKIIHLAATSDDPRMRKPVLDRARERFNYDPKMSLREGLKRTIECSKALMKAEDLAKASSNRNASFASSVSSCDVLPSSVGVALDVK